MCTYVPHSHKYLIHINEFDKKKNIVYNILSIRSMIYTHYSIVFTPLYTYKYYIYTLYKNFAGVRLRI